jgi:hypothetical protein
VYEYLNCYLEGLVIIRVVVVNVSKLVISRVSC